MQGGHDVPEEKIRSRYFRSISFLPQMILTADEVMIFDNSYTNIEPKLLFQKFMKGEENSNPHMITWAVEDDDITEWVIMYLMRPLEILGYSIPCFL